MTLRYFISLLIIAAVSFTACRNNNNIVKPGDYNVYLQSAESKKLKDIDTELSFWRNKLSVNSNDIAAQSKIAGLLTTRFAFSGNINEVHSADSLYRIINNVNRTTSSSTFRSLASNDITQHKFREAGIFIDSALQLGDNKYLSVLMEIDIAMELGDVQKAKTVLNSLQDKKDFPYLVRKAKILDHDGNGEEAIATLQEALKNINPEFEKASYIWAKTNLGDWLGHNNHYKESYESYLDALKVEPENYHALKGIAWLAYAHDKNTTEAKRILYYLMKVHPVPDYKLMMGEIAEFENNLPGKEKWYKEFLTDISNPLYGDMYNKYAFSLQADVFKNNSEALRIAEREVNNRPTALSYDMLAYALYKTGEVQKAYNISQTYVEGKCFEPFSIYHQGMIYKAAGEKEKAKKYLSNAYKSGYELGPVKANIIKKEVTKI
ncbi:MAG: hypothetical protein EKK37_13335 [Sphingobacteriales bacterium]|nr:MAG: hypothetical protein EKK37_13335 [Sphingobacteriales bacterium]